MKESENIYSQVLSGAQSHLPLMADESMSDNFLPLSPVSSSAKRILIMNTGIRYRARSGRGFVRSWA